MSKQEKETNKGDLIDVKSLIGDADGAGYSLDDIMAEYGHPSPPPEEKRLPAGEERFNTIEWAKISKGRTRPAASKPPCSGGQVVAFPGSQPVLPKEPDPPSEPQEPAEELESEMPEPAPVIPFPKEENVLSSFFKDLSRKADDYADHMFEEDEALDKQEGRRLEQLIPGTDLE